MCKSTFGIEMTSVPVEAGEAWHANVRKFEFSNRGTRLGTAYFDLASREGKYSQPALFTIRCGRDAQTPVVALVCSFASEHLYHREVEALFHEFGHCLHAILSRTQTQHFSGTRTVPDFVEFPSLLMEHFARDFRIVSGLTPDTNTKQALSEGKFDAFLESERMFRGIDCLEQLFLARLDIELHSGQHASMGDALARAQEATYPGEPLAEGNRRHTIFGHLTGYGASYYSYTFGRILAADAWRECFAADPLSLSSGRSLWNNVLAHGGARDPSICLREMLQRDIVSYNCTLLLE